MVINKLLFKRLLPYISIFVVIETLLRISLLLRALFDVELSSFNMIALLARGLWFDVVTGSFFLLFFALYYLLLPARQHGHKLDRILDGSFRFIFAFGLVFDVVAEHLFWIEFTTRFNFIAVDYLIYTQEVIGNIVESYPLFWLLVGVAVGSIAITWGSLRFIPLRATGNHYFTGRAASFVMLLALCGLLNASSNIEQAEFSDNAEANELAANGIYNLFSAFWHNEITYDRFYATQSNLSIEQNARDLLWEENAEFIHDDGKDLTRLVQMKGAEKHRNVMLVVMESMSADYMEAFGNKDELTPFLDQLADESLFFTDAYATGTRTVRGLEAVTLSIPPTPGQSIIRRPHNDNLFSLGFIFKDRGYDTKFIYGGYGYFDNMNMFFAGNGFDILDRTKMAKEEIHFANIWGVCDEDMFSRAIKEADHSYEEKKPFLHLIMTTSNHRPYTYPEGRIKIKSHTGRAGGVSYADYSIGKFIEQAKNKPWFNNTVFVFVADHTAGAGGKAELDPHKYHIPMMVYAPGIIKPQRYEKIASQIDISPILLGLLNFSYYTKFYGEDLLNDSDEIPHAFISNYQKVALVKENELTVLAPKRKVEYYSWPKVETTVKNNHRTNDAIAYYQSASWWKEQYTRLPYSVASK